MSLEKIPVSDPLLGNGQYCHFKGREICNFLVLIVEIETAARNQPTEQHVVRLLSFVPGKILYGTCYTKDLFFQVGELVAKTDLALMVKI